MVLVWGLAIPVFSDYWSGVLLGDVPTKELPKNPEKKKPVVKQNWSLKVCHRAWQRSNDKSKPWSFGVGCFVEFEARPVNVRNQGFKKKDIKGVGDWCPGKLDVTFPFVHFWMVFAAGPWVLGVAHVWYRFAKLTPQPRVWFLYVCRIVRFMCKLQNI